MNEAKSLYLNRKIIFANDKSLNYLSYEQLGLRCRCCGEPVLLKRGEKRAAHFAHFPERESLAFEECEYRYYIDTANKIVNNQNDNEGQSLEKFYDYFLKIFTVNKKDFFVYLKRVEDGSLTTDLDVFKSKCSNFFLKKESIWKHICNSQENLDVQKNGLFLK